jgi:hypothetical protein
VTDAIPALERAFAAEWPANARATVQQVRELCAAAQCAENPVNTAASESFIRVMQDEYDIKVETGVGINEEVARRRLYERVCLVEAERGANGQVKMETKAVDVILPDSVHFCQVRLIVKLYRPADRHDRDEPSLKKPKKLDEGRMGKRVNCGKYYRLESIPDASRSARVASTEVGYAIG